ncbi:hypothetical protein pdam_00021312, partial [Pocillopora damicornis]
MCEAYQKISCAEVETCKERHVILATEEQLAKLTEAKWWYVVGSFKLCCPPLSKLFSISAFVQQGGEMNIKVDVNYLKPKEQNMQTGMLATETVRYQEVILPRVSATSAASGSASCPQTEDLHTHKEEIFLSIILNYFNAIKPQSIEEFNRFMEYAEKMRLIITGVSKGSLVIT